MRRHDGMNVLVLTHRLPFAPNTGDRVRAFHILRLLADRADVQLVSLVHDRTEAAEGAALRDMGVRFYTARVPRISNLARGVLALPTRTPLTHVLLDSPEMQAALTRAVRERPPDVVLSYCSGIAPYAMNPHLAGVPLVLDMVDVDSAKWAAMAASASPPLSWVFGREARRLAAFEARAARRAVATTVVNERERAALLAVCPDVKVHVVPNGVDLGGYAPPAPPTAEPRVIFTGVFSYGPNIDGAVWFANAVWPRVRAAVPLARLTLAGMSPSRVVKRLAARDSSIEVTGRVDDIRPYLWRSAAAIAPISQARGVQNKVLEAIAAGLPCVVTPEVWNGLPAEVLAALRLGRTVEEFASHVIDLLIMPPDWRRHEASRARLAGLSWSDRLAPIVELIDANVAAPRRASA